MLYNLWISCLSDAVNLAQNPFEVKIMLCLLVHTSLHFNWNSAHCYTTAALISPHTTIWIEKCTDEQVSHSYIWDSKWQCLLSNGKLCSIHDITMRCSLWKKMINGIKQFSVVQTNEKATKLPTDHMEYHSYTYRPHGMQQCQTMKKQGW